VTIERKRYELYLEASATAKAFEREVTPFALDILHARFPWIDGAQPVVRFTKETFFVDDRHGKTYGCRTELLFDALWKEIALEALRQDRNRLLAIAELSERAEKARVKKTELEQLAALVAKYPKEAKEAANA
jgi:hypothetical protein